jgi:hypothetical protein
MHIGIIKNWVDLFFVDWHPIRPDGTTLNRAFRSMDFDGLSLLKDRKEER